MAQHSYTEHEEQQICEMWKKGMSARDISMVMGKNISRNAIIGKVHRMGLSAAKVAKPKHEMAKPTGEEVRACQWIEGDPAYKDTKFCGAPLSGRTSYCAEHAAVCLVGIVAAEDLIKGGVSG